MKKQKAESKADKYGKRERRKYRDTEWVSPSEEDNEDGLRQCCLPKYDVAETVGSETHKKCWIQVQPKKGTVLRFHSFYIHKGSVFSTTTT